MARLWPLPLLAGLLPLAATAIAYALAWRAGGLPDCNPFLEGCISISRTARYGLANVLFRALVLPAAVLQGLCWLAAPGWLRALGVPSDRWLRALPAIGLVAAVALVLYGTFLGVEGDGYRAMRRYAIPMYFGFSCIAMVVLAQHARRALPRPVALALVAACACLPLLGLVHALLPLWLDAPRQDALENVIEWWAGAIFTAFFLALAWAWQRTGTHSELHATAPG